MERSPHRVQRPLDTAEASFLALNATGAFLHAQVAEVEGPLSADLLQAALAHVQERHPLLRARVAWGAVPAWFTPAVQPPPLTVARPGTDPMASAEEELHRLYRPDAEPLWRCTLIPGDDGVHHLILGMHHSLADGRSGWQILADVLATCAALARRTPLPPFLPVGPALDDVLGDVPRRARFAHLLQRLGERGRQAVACAGEQQSSGPLRSRILGRTLAAPLLEALLERARAAGTTLTGVLAAALLAAIAELDEGAPTIALSHAVSLRDLVSPPIPCDQLGCFATGVTTRHEVIPSRALWALAREVSGELRSRLRRGDPIADVVAARGPFARVERAARRRAQLGGHGVVALSNRGRLALGDIQPFRLARWHGATGNHVQGDRCHFSCSTVCGQLSVGFVHVEPLVTRAMASGVLARFEERLTMMASDGDPRVASASASRRSGDRLALAS